METVPQWSCVCWLHIFSPVTSHFAKLIFRDKGEKSVRSRSFHARTNYTFNLQSIKEGGGSENTELTKTCRKCCLFGVSSRSPRATGDEDIVTVPFGSFCRLNILPVLHVGKT